MNAICLATLMWLTDSVVHKFMFGEESFKFVPDEINELWMRTTIVVLLILFGIYADKQTKKIMEKEREKEAIYNATVVSAQHILNNLMNKIQYFKIVAEENNIYTPEVAQVYEETIQNGEDLVSKLSSVKVLTEENISNSVYPKQEK